MENWVSSHFCSVSLNHNYQLFLDVIFFSPNTRWLVWCKSTVAHLGRIKMLSEEDFVNTSCSQFTSKSDPSISGNFGGWEILLFFFFYGQIRRPFWGSLPPGLLFGWYPLCYVSLGGIISFEFLGKSHSVKGRIPRQGVVDVIFSRQNLQRYDCPSDEFQMEKW